MICRYCEAFMESMGYGDYICDKCGAKYLLDFCDFVLNDDENAGWIEGNGNVYLVSVKPRQNWL